MSKKLSKTIEEIRDKLFWARSELKDSLDKHPFRERFIFAEGSITSLMISLYSVNQELKSFEIKCEDDKKGKSLPFSSRGIGLDVCPGCFVCGENKREDSANNHYLNNISALVKSKEEGETILGWFPKGARLDFRPSESNRIQVKVGACDKHLPNLDFLDNNTRENGYIIRQIDIKEAIDFVKKEDKVAV